jgi:methionyl-tRNA formyltransferase
LRIVLIGQAAFGEKVLEALLNKGENVVAVFCPPEGRGDPPWSPSPLRQLAEGEGIPVYQPRRMRDPEVYNTFVKLQPGLNVMAFVTDIVPQRILDCPSYGSIQYHPSLLPRHRGGSAIPWAVANGETRTGLTIFWPDQGIDTGPILLQKEVEITPDDTTGSLYFNKLFPLGVEALVEAVEMVRHGTAPRIPQDESLATYEPLCTEERMVIDWDKPVAQVYNLIRGANPQPGAVTTFRGKKLKIFDCQRQELPHPATPGETLAISEEGVLIAGNGGAILVKRVQPEGGAKVKVLEFVTTSGLKVGDRLIAPR